MFIEDFGWDSYFEAHWSEIGNAGCVPARVISQHRGLWRVAGDFEECWAEPSGSFARNPKAGAIGPLWGIGFLSRRDPKNRTL